MVNVGDMAFLGKQMERFQSRLAAMLERRIDPRLRARIDVPDVLQETYVEAHRRWQKSHGTVPAESYVWWYGIARDQLIEIWRRNTRAVRDLHVQVALPSRSSVFIAERLYAAQETPSAIVRRAEQWQGIEAAIEQLPEEDQELLWMHIQDGLKFTEIAEVLRCKPGTARMRYARAITKLRNLAQHQEN